MLLVAHHHMVKTLPSDAPDKALDIRIQPWTLRGDHALFDTHARDALPEGRAVDAVAIAEQIPGRLVPWANPAMISILSVHH